MAMQFPTNLYLILESWKTIVATNHSTVTHKESYFETKKDLQDQDDDTCEMGKEGGFGN
jgi:hypothetical protein